MRGGREEVRGSVAVETALALPFLMLLIVGGWVLGYLVYSKVALAMVANRAARDLAADTKLYSLLKDRYQPYRYDGGFAESFGLPRWGLHAVAMKAPILNETTAISDHAILVAVCYRVPFTIPFGVAKRTEPPRIDTGAVQELVLDAADVADLIGTGAFSEALRQAEAEYRHQKQLLEEEAAAWDRLREDAVAVKRKGEDLWQKGEWVGRLIRQLFGREAPDFQKFGKRVQTMELEEVVRTLCDPPERLQGESIVLTARAAYMMQPVFVPAQPGGPQPAAQKRGGRT